jgi:hypothetical protein
LLNGIASAQAGRSAQLKKSKWRPALRRILSVVFDLAYVGNMAASGRRAGSQNQTIKTQQEEKPWQARAA